MKHKNRLIGMLIGILIAMASISCWIFFMVKRVLKNRSARHKIKEMVMDIFWETMRHDESYTPDYTDYSNYVRFNQWPNSKSGRDREDDEDWDSYESCNPSRDEVRVEED